MNIIEARNIVKNYENHCALDNVSLEAPQGVIYGLLGPNGAGKTTLIRIINRITMADSGSLLFCGEPMKADDVFSIGYLPEERGLYKKMKVGEQILFFAQLKGLSKHEALRRLKPWFVKFDITSWWNKRIEELSKGMAQKIQFIATVIHEPKLLIFDEPFSGFDPINAELLRNEILGLKERGATIIFSTHNMTSVEQICDHITLINKSKNILTGKVSDIRRSYHRSEYRLEFTGDPILIEPLLGGSPVEQKADHYSVLLKLEQQNKRQMIEDINSKVDIQSIMEVLPTMDDIFINKIKLEAASQ